jgi:hypothetical protein
MAEPLPPQNFVRHPVADSRKPTLQKQNGLDRRFAMSIQELIDKLLIELRRGDLRRPPFPPIRSFSAMMKPDATELPRISEDKRAFGLIKHEVVMFVRLKIPGFDANPPGHAEMNPEPVMVRKCEEHRLPRASERRSFSSTNLRCSQDLFPKP